MKHAQLKPRKDCRVAFLSAGAKPRSHDSVKWVAWPMQDQLLRQRHRRRLQHQQQQPLQPRRLLWGVPRRTTTRICVSSVRTRSLLRVLCRQSGWAGSRLPGVPNTDHHGYARICLTMYIFGLIYSRYAWLCPSQAVVYIFAKYYWQFFQFFSDTLCEICSCLQ